MMKMRVIPQMQGDEGLNNLIPQNQYISILIIFLNIDIAIDELGT